MTPPEIHLRVHDEPVQRNRQLQKKNNRREPAERRHARILAEPALWRKYFSSRERPLTIERFRWTIPSHSFA
jgi:hypothetical protein